jgi:hypothetical protein
MLKAYVGEEARPPMVVVDDGRKRLPLIVRWRAWHGDIYRPVHAKLNCAMRAVLHFAHRDPSIMPVNRYCSSREAVGSVMSKYSGSQMVMQVQVLQFQAREAWKAAVEAELVRLDEAYARHCHASVEPRPCSDAALRAAATARVHDLAVGMFDRIGCACTACLSRKQSQGYHFCTGPQLCSACMSQACKPLM